MVDPAALAKIASGTTVAALLAAVVAKDVSAVLAAAGTAATGLAGAILLSYRIVVGGKARLNREIAIEWAKVEREIATEKARSHAENLALIAQAEAESSKVRATAEAMAIDILEKAREGSLVEDLRLARLEIQKNAAQIALLGIRLHEAILAVLESRKFAAPARHLDPNEHDRPQ